MNPMVERVARALMDAANRVMDTHVRPLTWAEVLNEPRNGILIEARAAIAAMREPTDEMLRAGAETGDWPEREISAKEFAWRKNAAKEVFMAMIDAALKDGK